MLPNPNEARRARARRASASTFVDDLDAFFRARLGVTPDLPASLPQFRQPRYRKEDVASWLRTGSRVRAPRLVRAS